MPVMAETSHIIANVCRIFPHMCRIVLTAAAIQVLQVIFYPFTCNNCATNCNIFLIVCCNAHARNLYIMQLSSNRIIESVHNSKIYNIYIVLPLGSSYTAVFCPISDNFRPFSCCNISDLDLKT